MTLVSIITPSFNQAAYLEQTLRSVLEQDHPQLEYLVIDGGSTDGSDSIIRRYESRLAWWVSERDRGQAEAINKGLDRARGELVAWLNSDDYYLPGAVRAAVAAFEEHPQAALIYGNMLAVDQTGAVINRLTYRPLTLEDLMCFQIIGQPAVFMRRSALGELRLDPAYHLLLDHHLWIRLACRGKILHVDQVWSAARYHAAAKNRARAAEFGAEAFRILEGMREDAALAPRLRGVERRARASAHRVNARYLLDGGLPAAALTAWTRALGIHPPTALARANLLASALLELLGLGALRNRILDRRRERLR